MLKGNTGLAYIGLGKKSEGINLVSETLMFV